MEDLNAEKKYTQQNSQWIKCLMYQVMGDKIGNNNSKNNHNFQLVVLFGSAASSVDTFK